MKQTAETTPGYKAAVWNLKKKKCLEWSWPVSRGFRSYHTSDPKSYSWLICNCQVVKV